MKRLKGARRLSNKVQYVKEPEYTTFVKEKMHLDHYEDLAMESLGKSKQEVCTNSSANSPRDESRGSNKRGNKMSKGYMNRVFQDTFYTIFKHERGATRKINSPLETPEEYWRLDENTGVSAAHAIKRRKDRGFFNEAELRHLRLIDKKKGMLGTLDETGKSIDKEQQKINKLVKYYMVKAELIPSDKEREAEAKVFAVEPVNPKSPYKSDRQRVRYFEKPEKIYSRVEAFRDSVKMRKTLGNEELEMMLKHIKDD